MGLDGMVALVTGGDTGIGKAICQRFAEEGADLVVNYIGELAPAEALVDEIKAHGRRGLAIEADIAQATAVTAMFKQAIGTLGRIDVLINNAGIEKRAPFLDINVEDFDRVLAVNLRGAFLCAQAAARDMVKRKRGRIINISSVHEDLPFPEFAAYTASKGGMRMLMRTMALELAPYGVTVNDIAPGAIATPINKQTLADPEKVAALNGIIPLGRMGQPEEVAGVAAFLASPDAAYVTGSTYYVDGGMVRFARSL
jgi:glucose 1-dehydrogenase